ncbi:unnamed protein product [Amoebophrya sp. A120]|nr:unnamed protein product [Amoebophrya sp. A120]|eukprot:GSA120T00009967001.1
MLPLRKRSSCGLTLRPAASRLSSTLLLLLNMHFNFYNNQTATAVMQMPESFEANADWEIKERWQRAKPYIKCPVCQIVVRHMLEQVEEDKLDPKDEDKIYDFFDSVCDTNGIGKSKKPEDLRAVLERELQKENEKKLLEEAGGASGGEDDQEETAGVRAATSDKDATKWKTEEELTVAFQNLQNTMKIGSLSGNLMDSGNKDSGNTGEQDTTGNAKKTGMKKDLDDDYFQNDPDDLFGRYLILEVPGADFDLANPNLDEHVTDGRSTSKATNTMQSIEFRQPHKKHKKNAPKYFYKVIRRTQGNDPEIEERKLMMKKMNETDSEGYKVPIGQGNKFWQKHAMAEVCTESVRSNDDNLKDVLRMYSYDGISLKKRRARQMLMEKFHEILGYEFTEEPIEIIPQNDVDLTKDPLVRGHLLNEEEKNRSKVRQADLEKRVLTIGQVSRAFCMVTDVCPLMGDNMAEIRFRSLRDEL